MKADRRHELEQNDLAKWVGPKVESAKKYGLLILGIVVAVVAIIVTIVMIQNSQAESREGQWAKVIQLTSEEYFLQQRDLLQEDSTAQLTQADMQKLNDKIEQDLRNAIDEDPESLAAIRGKLFLADRARTRGISALFNDRDAAMSQLNEAIDLYEEIAAIAEETPVRHRVDYYRADSLVARSGLGDLTDLDKAKEIYQGLSEKGLFAQAAKEQLEVLDRPSTNPNGYFAWFHQQLDRLESTSGSSSGDGGLPSFLEPPPGTPSTGTPSSGIDGVDPINLGPPTTTGGN